MATSFGVDLIFRSQGGGKIRNLSNQLQGVERSGKGAQAGLDRASRSMDRMSGKARTAAGAIGGLVKGFLAFQGIKFAVGAAAEIERTQKQLETLTGSASTALRVYKELQQVNKESPFELKELTAAAAKLSAFGVSTEELVETTKRLGKVAAGTGQEIGGIALAYGQVLAKGRLQGEELLQFQERGIPLAAELQRMLGVTGEEFQKMVSKGQVGSDKVAQAMKNLTGETGRFGKSFENTAGTIDAKLSNLKDAFYNAAGALVKAFEPQLKWLIDRFTDVANYFIRVFNRLSDLQKGGARQQAELQASAAAQKATRDKFGVLGSLSPEAQKFRKAYEKNELFNFEANRNNDGPAKPVKKPPQRSTPTPDPDKDSSSSSSSSAAKQLDNGAELLRQLQQSVALTETKSALDKTILGISQKYQDTLLDISKLEDQSLKGQLEEAALRQRNAEINEAVTQREQARKKTLDGILQSMRNESELIGVTTEAGQRRVQLEQQIRQLQADGVITSKSEADELRRQNDELEKKRQKLEQIAGSQREQNALYDQLAGSIAGGVGSAIDAVADSTRNLGEALQDIGRQILAAVGKMLIFYGLAQAFGALGGADGKGVFSYLAKAFGGDAGKLGFRAGGGPVSAGGSYVVGENGPELLQMNGDGSGYVHSNTSSAMSRYKPGAGPSAAGSSEAAGGAAEAGGSNVYNFETTRFMDKDWVDKEQLVAAMDVAAKRGAEGGYSKTIGAMRNSRSTRARLGMG